VCHSIAKRICKRWHSGRSMPWFRSIDWSTWLFYYWPWSTSTIHVIIDVSTILCRLHWPIFVLLCFHANYPLFLSTLFQNWWIMFDCKSFIFKFASTDGKIAKSLKIIAKKAQNIFTNFDHFSFQRS
jgi:hypothetical protein